MTTHTDRIRQIEAEMTSTLESEFLKALDRGHNVISGNGIEDRIRQMAQEAGFERFKDESVDPINFEPSPDGMWVLWDDDALTRFAQLVAEDCAREMRAEIAKMAPTISEAAKQGDSVTHVVEMCAAAAAFYVSARYSLKD